MIRVKPDRCGYDRYTCTGLPELAAANRYDRMVCDPSRNRTSGFPATDFNYIDNYLNVPTRLKGFVMTQPHIHDFSDVSIIPEVSCLTDIDPFEGTKIDAYNNNIQKIDARVWETSDYVLMHSQLLCCRDDAGKEGVFEPGILEPVMDTMFPVVPAGLNTAIDAELDGIMIVLIQLTKWRLQVDEILSNLAKIRTHIDSVRALLSAMNKSSICSSFKIRLVSGKPLYTGTVPGIPRYYVSGGSVTINGSGSASVSAQYFSAPFYAYINLSLVGANDEGQYQDVTASMSESPGGDYYLGIGGVRKVTAGKYTLFEIYQERCAASVELVRTSKSGVLWRDSSGKSPYKVLEVEECPSDEGGDSEDPGTSGGTGNNNDSLH